MHAGYDGAYGAAHTAAGAIEMIGTVERAFVFEIQDGKDPAGKEYWGRWGLFTHSSFGAKAKPRYRALQLLNKLGNERLELLGKGTYIKAVASAHGDGVYSLALANFDPAGRNVENVPITMTSLPAGTYLTTMQFLNRPPITISTAITALGALEFQVPMSPQEVAWVEIKPQPAQ